MMTEQEHNNVQCTIFAQTERSSQIHLDDAEVQPKITQKRSDCVMDNVQWRKVKLGDCLSIGNGCDYKHLKEGDIPVFGTGGIMTYVDNYLYDGETVCIGRKGTINHPMYHIGKIWTVDTLFYTHSFVGVIPKFIYYTFCNIDWNKYNEATGVPSLSKETIYKIEIPVPDLSAQRRIAAILASADKVIAATQKLIAKYKQMKQGMMEDLLKPKEGWKMVKLGEVCEPSSEKYNPLTENTFQYCIEMENINQESGTINGKSDITKLLSLKTKFHKGEVLYGKLRPYLKKYWLADFDGACSTEIWVLKKSENIDNQFLFYLFQSDCINRIANQSSGTKMPRADWKFMKKQTVSIPFKNDKPDLTEQRRIAAILSGIDAKIAAEEKVLEKYEKVKKGLMEKLLNE